MNAAPSVFDPLFTPQQLAVYRAIGRGEGWVTVESLWDFTAGGFSTARELTQIADELAELGWLQADTKQIGRRLPQRVWRRP